MTVIRALLQETIFKFGKKRPLRPKTYRKAIKLFWMTVK